MNNVRYLLRDDRDTECAKGAAVQISSLMRTLNLDDILPLCAEFRRGHNDEGDHCVHPDSVYGHLREALTATLRMLGVPNGDKMDLAVQDLHDGVLISRVLQVYASASHR